MLPYSSRMMSDDVIVDWLYIAIELTSNTQDHWSIKSSEARVEERQ